MDHFVALSFSICFLPSSYQLLESFIMRRLATLLSWVESKTKLEEPTIEKPTTSLSPDHVTNSVKSILLQIIHSHPRR